MCSFRLNQLRAVGIFLSPTVFSSSGANYAGLGGKGNSDYCNLKIERGKKVLADVRM
jgi:hypothetical protein